MKSAFALLQHPLTFSFRRSRHHNHFGQLLYPLRLVFLAMGLIATHLLRPLSRPGDHAGLASQVSQVGDGGQLSPFEH